MLTAPPDAAVSQDFAAQEARPPLIKPGYLLGFALITSLFFLWAIANNFNDILIRQFQKALDINRAEAGVIQFAFYMGYFIMALPAGLLMRKLGYRAGIMAGLGLYATGAFLFFPAAEIQTYAAFLVALFVMASGVAFLETAANPYIVAFGPTSRASQRLTLAQAFNGVGGALAPALGGLFIFSGIEHDSAAIEAMSAAELAAYRASEAQMVQVPYLILGGVVLLILVAIALVKLPDPVEDGAGTTAGPSDLRGLLRAPGFAGAVLAQFFYCGAQVSIWSFFVDFVKEVQPETPEKTAAYLLSFSLVLFMIGRFTGAALMARFDAGRLLMLFALINVGLCIAAALLPGTAAIAALTLTSFFMSIMFPTIFAQGVRNLGPMASLGSSFIVMAIVGGALFPPLMGLVSTMAASIQIAVLVPIISFAAIALYARGESRRTASP